MIDVEPVNVMWWVMDEKRPPRRLMTILRETNKLGRGTFLWRCKMTNECDLLNGFL